jgi:hypothetical protein
MVGGVHYPRLVRRRNPIALPALRHEFEIAGDVASARLHITALSVYRAEINGALVS